MRAQMGLAGCRVLALSFALAGCMSDSVVGTSGTPPAAPPQVAPMAEPAPALPPPAAAPVMASKPKETSLFSSKRGEDVGMSNLFLGDIDGDGFDDFFIMSVIPQPNPDVFLPELLGHEARIYVYYGRPNFPTRLSIDDADAVFESASGGTGPLGDINGDGYDDFVIQRGLGMVEIIFGSHQRLKGMVTQGAAGVLWIGLPTPMPFTGDVSEFYMTRAGDFNGDGFDDLAVGSSRPWEAGEDNPESFFALMSSFYLVLGHGGAWPSVHWDPSMAVARFGTDHFQGDETVGQSAYDMPLAPAAAGDLDADGYDDLTVPGAAKTYIFYGGRPLSGIVRGTDADASIAHYAFSLPTAMGDADGDGAADLVVGSLGGGMQVLYGKRWVGANEIEGDLEIDTTAVSAGQTAAAAGDIDGDGAPDIVLAAAQSGYDWSSNIARPPTGALYVVRGTGYRQLGTYALKPTDLLMKGPLAGAQDQNSPQSGLGTTLSMSGDVDGDGGRDILTSSPGAIVSAQSLGAVFLLPSTPKTPQ